MTTTILRRWIRKIRVSPFVVLLLMAFWLADSRLARIYMGISALLHEAAHIVALRTLGIGIKNVNVGLTGARLDIRDEEMISYNDELFYSLAGPMANLILAMGLIAASFTITIPLVETFIFYNLSFCLLNILPVFPLDGGRALRALLFKRMPYHTAHRLTYTISIITALMMTAAGLLLLFSGGWNGTLAIAGSYLLICALFMGRKG